MTTLTSIVIPTRNNFKFLSRCLLSLEQQDSEDSEIIVVDNDSTDKSPFSVRCQFPYVRLIEVGRNAFFCEGVNIGIAQASGEYIALVNDDTEFTPTWLSNAVSAFQWGSDIGFVASKILSLRDKRLIDSAGDHLMPNGQAGNIGWSQLDIGQFDTPDEVFSACAAGAVYRRSLLLRVRGFDESFTAYYDDIDVGFRLQLLGFRCAYNPAAVMYHYGSGSERNRSESLRLVERNMILTLAKNMPTPLLRKYMNEILKANLSPIELYRWSDKQRQRLYIPWLFGKLGSIRLLRQALQKRKSIQSGRRVSIEYLDNLMQKHTDIDVASDMLPVHNCSEKNAGSDAGSTASTNCV